MAAKNDKRADLDVVLGFEVPPTAEAEPWFKVSSDRL